MSVHPPSQSAIRAGYVGYIDPGALVTQAQVGGLLILHDWRSHWYIDQSASSYVGASRQCDRVDPSRRARSTRELVRADLPLVFRSPEWSSLSLGRLVPPDQAEALPARTSQPSRWAAYRRALELVERRARGRRRPSFEPPRRRACIPSARPRRVLAEVENHVDDGIAYFARRRERASMITTRP
jgi:hypothetical protein